MNQHSDTPILGPTENDPQPSIRVYSPGSKVRISLASRQVEAEIAAVQISRAGSGLLTEYECAWFVNDQVVTGKFRDHEIELLIAGERVIGFK